MAEKAELEKFRAQAALEEQNIALAKRGLEAFIKGDVDALKEIVAPGFVRYLPSNKMDIRSLEELIEYGKVLRTAFPDVIVLIEEIYAKGDRVICRWTMRGTHQGEWAGIPATGNKFEISGIGVWRFENGKAMELREEPDSLGLLQQLGMELRPKEVKR